MEEINIINILKPDFIGFVFAQSKRRVDIQMVDKMIADLCKGIKICFVFSEQGIETILNVCNLIKPDIIQLHSIKEADLITGIKEKIDNVEIWKAVAYNKIGSITGEADRYLIDAVNPGSGVSFNWDVLEKIPLDRSKVIVAGGLGPGNIEELKVKYDPFCVDASSMLEVNGIKNFDLVKEFIVKARKSP